MGIAWLLLKRMFLTRPKRTILFVLGYALSTAVMVTLLSVGEAVLQQAQDKDLLGGGDLILVPQGIDVESLKVGGTSALYHTIPQGRFIVRQLLQSTRFENEIDTVSPYILSRLLYVRSPFPSMPVEATFADGSIPDAEKKIKNVDFPWRNTSVDQQWLQPDPSRFYHEIDHFHLPSAPNAPLDRWAEWHYFNFDSRDFYGYLSIMVAGNILNGEAEWIISLQLIDSEYRRYSASVPASRNDLPLQKVHYKAGNTTVRYHNDHYEIDLDFQDKIRISGKLKYYPAPGLYFPPSILAESDDFESGYVIPALRGTYEGALQVGTRIYNFDRIAGYHDHNWGIWRQIEWNWGHLYSEEYSIFFGEIFLQGKSKGLFAGVFDRKGFVTLFRPEQIVFSDYQKQPEGIQIPHRLQMSQTKPFATLQLDGKATSVTSTSIDENNSSYFIQSKMIYNVTLEIDGVSQTFNAFGNSETFVRRQ